MEDKIEGEMKWKLQRDKRCGATDIILNVNSFWRGSPFDATRALRV